MMNTIHIGQKAETAADIVVADPEFEVTDFLVL